METPLRAFFNSMVLKVFFTFWMLLFSFAVMAQKKLHKMMLAHDINVIQVNTANCFEVNVHTVSGNEVTVEAELEGEYSRELDLEMNLNGSTVFIEANFVPNFENPNDKLSAHKVVSILLNITVPSYKNVKMYGTNSRVNVDGKFEDLQVSLSDGSCSLHSVTGTADIKTQSGSIVVESPGARIEAESKYGHVAFNPIPKGSSTYKLQTVTGNIEFSKTE